MVAALWFLVEVEGEVLLVQSLLAEIEELQLPGKVFADDVLDPLVHRGLVDVPVDLREDVNLVPVNIEGPFEEPGHVVLQHGQGLVELLQHPDHRVVLLHVLLRLAHRDLGVKPSAVIRMTTEEHSLSAMIAESVAFMGLTVAALRVVRRHTRFIILSEPIGVG